MNAASIDVIRAGGGEKAAVRTLEKLTPWTVSLLFHVGVFLVLIFCVYFAAPVKDIPAIIVPSDFSHTDADFTLSARPAVSQNVSSSAAVPLERPAERERASELKVITVPADKAEAAPYSSIHDKAILTNVNEMIATSGAGKVPGFVNVSYGNAKNVVFVLDASGSMGVSGAYNAVQSEMARSLYSMSDATRYNIVLYTSGEPVRFTKGLTAAKLASKRRAMDFLAAYHCEGPSDPRKALEAAFGMLKKARGGSVIYLLSDGEFRGEGLDNRKVVETIRKLNSHNKITINTILMDSSQKEALDVMKLIADENDGRFTAVRF